MNDIKDFGSKNPGRSTGYRKNDALIFVKVIEQKYE
jgi:hypothetical protein